MIHDTRDTESAGAAAWRARQLSLTTVDRAFDQYWSSKLAGLPFYRRLWLAPFETICRRAWVAGLSMRYDLNELLLKACRRYAYENLYLKGKLEELEAGEAALMARIGEAELEASYQKRTRSPI